MSEKIVEAVARALAESNGDDPDEQVQMFFTKGEGPLWENYSGMARAAIEAYEAEKNAEDDEDLSAVAEALGAVRYTPDHTPLMSALERENNLWREKKP